MEVGIEASTVEVDYGDSVFSLKSTVIMFVCLIVAVTVDIQEKVVFWINIIFNVLWLVCIVFEGI